MDIDAMPEDAFEERDPRDNPLWDGDYQEPEDKALEEFEAEEGRIVRGDKEY